MLQNPTSKSSWTPSFAKLTTTVLGTSSSRCSMRSGRISSSVVSRAGGVSSTRSTSFSRLSLLPSSILTFCYSNQPYAQGRQDPHMHSSLSNLNTLLHLATLSLYSTVSQTSTLSRASRASSLSSPTRTPLCLEHIPPFSSPYRSSSATIQWTATLPLFWDTRRSFVLYLLTAEDEARPLVNRLTAWDTWTFILQNSMVIR